MGATPTIAPLIINNFDKKGAKSQWHSPFAIQAALIFLCVCLFLFSFCSTDEFSVEGSDVGAIKAVSVKRDDSGPQPGWKLLTVRLPSILSYFFFARTLLYKVSNATNTYQWFGTTQMGDYTITFSLNSKRFHSFRRQRFTFITLQLLNYLIHLLMFISDWSKVSRWKPWNWDWIYRWLPNVGGRKYVD